MKTNKRLNGFLVGAKRSTYASAGEGGEQKLPDGTKEFVYKKGLFKYRDRYSGSNPFIGEEIVFHKLKSIWGMNYRGRVIVDNIDPQEVYNFLKKALHKVTVKHPYRGPKTFTNGCWEYSYKVQGSFGNFFGQEVICYKNKKVYELLFHGGKIY